MKIYNQLIVVFLLLSYSAFGQQVAKTFTLEEVIKLSQEQSPDAIRAKHRFRASYWEMRTYKAEFLPKMSFNVTPNYSHAYEKNWNSNSNKYEYNTINNFTADAGVNIYQQVGLTGGSFFIQSNLNGIYNISDTTTMYNSSPLSVGYRQNINGFNELKWKKKIEPLKYDEAKSNYIRSMENVSAKAVDYFFQLMLAQRNLEIANMNYSNTDTLYKIAQGRYNIGTIAENELLQMELSNLNAGLNLNEAGIDLEMKKFQIRSFLGFNESVDINLEVPESINSFDVNVQRAIEEANANSPDILSYSRQLLEAERDVKKARAERGLNADLYASVGLTQRADAFSRVYENPSDQQRVSLGINIPILDWGLAKGRYRMAKSNQEVVKTNIDQARVDFEQQIFLKVMQFNLQDDQVNIAAKADTIAQNRYEVTKQRFLIGKINVLDLNDSQKSKDEANTRYISAMNNYWRYYFELRKLTLYDFESNQKILYDINSLTD